MSQVSAESTGTFRMWRRLRGRPGGTRLFSAAAMLRATARLVPPDFGAITEGTDVVVAVSITDRAGTEVVRADITTWVTPA